MQNGNSILKTVRAGFEREPRINVHRWPIRIAMSEDCVLVMEGEVESLAAKKLAREIAGAVPEVRGVVDRLQVVPAEPRGDGEILASLETLLLEARDLKNCTVRMEKKGQALVLREVRDADASGDILVAVREGVVTLDGWVISLSHKRLAGVLAWWVPGCRDVVDALEVLPPERDGDDEVSDILSLVLEMDPMIPHPEQIRVQTHNYVVTLEGLVNTQTEKNRAEQDAWSLFAVDKVINQLAVAAA
ncbi:MAG: BON domain-containing protein [Hyphomicrobiaceae bacterium]